LRAVLPLRASRVLDCRQTGADPVPPRTAARPLPRPDYRLIVAASLLLSLWLIAIDPLINRDAIIYLRSAEAYLEEGFAASQQIFGRPLLPILFATVHQLTGLPLVFSGQLVNSLFYALLCAGFVATVHTLGGDRRTQLLAAIVILSHPVLNEHRSSIMRDPAYLALLLLAFRELLLYVRTPLPGHRWRWLGLVLAATGFRFEGLFFALLAPLALLCVPGLQRRTHHCLGLMLPLLAALGALLAGVALYRSALGPQSQLFPGIGDYWERLLQFPARFGELAATTAATLEFSAREDAAVALLAGLAAILLLNICRALTWPWLITLLWGARRALAGRLSPDHLVLLAAHLLIALLYLTGFTLINRFMLERYAGQLVIFLLLCLPFVLDTLWRAGGRRDWRKLLVAGLLLGMSLDTLYNRDYQKAFIRDATSWLRENTPRHCTLVSNDRYIAWFSRRRFDWQSAGRNGFDREKLLASPALWRSGDYLAMRVKPGDRDHWLAFLAQHGLREAVVFEGGRHGQVSVVELPHEADAGEKRKAAPPGGPRP
jgi:hypothetical protein